jgi:hypothetical protein
MAASLQSTWNFARGSRKESRGLEEIKVSEAPELPAHRGMVHS